MASNAIGSFNIVPLDESLRPQIQQKLDTKTKPQGSLGAIERVGLRIAMIQRTLTPSLKSPSLIVFAGDHGICEERVSAFPQAVTAQMVNNFLSGGAAINVLARQHQMDFSIVDAGVIGELSPSPKLQRRKVAQGTQNFMRYLAMSEQQVADAVRAGAETIKETISSDCNVVLLGEMGIGNSTSAAALTHLVTGVTIGECVGAGSGVGMEGVYHKSVVIEKALSVHRHFLNGSGIAGQYDPVRLLSAFGGYEIAMLVGAYLQSAELGLVVVVDGFIASAALAIASLMNPLVLDYCVFSHSSAEQGHGALLSYFRRKPVLNLGLRLGEASGAAMAYPLLQSSVNLLNEMASFNEACVSESLK